MVKPLCQSNSYRLSTSFISLLVLMFMKYYAPNRCFYIKVAKLRTGVGNAEMSYLQNCSVKLFKEHIQSPNLQREIIRKK